MKDANLGDLINMVAINAEIPVTHARKAVNATLQGIIELTESAGGLSIRTFGRFDKRRRKSRMQSNPINGAPQRIPAKETVFFTLSPQLVKDLRDE